MDPIYKDHLIKVENMRHAQKVASLIAAVEAGYPVTTDEYRHLIDMVSPIKLDVYAFIQVKDGDICIAGRMHGDERSIVVWFSETSQGGWATLGDGYRVEPADKGGLAGWLRGIAARLRAKFR